MKKFVFIVVIGIVIGILAFSCSILGQENAPQQFNIDYRTLTYIPLTSTPNPTVTAYPTVTPDISCLGRTEVDVNVRTGPSLEYDTVNIVTKETFVPVRARNHDGTWLYISGSYVGESSYIKGWVFSNLIKLYGQCNNLIEITE